MTAQALINPLPTFVGLDGKPLASGYVYIGEPDQDPRAYPTDIFYDVDMAVSATQPLRTTAGFIYRNGSPANVWMEAGAHSLLVLDSAGRQIAYLPQWLGPLPTSVQQVTVDRFSGTGAQTAFTLSTTPSSKNNTLVYVAGVYQQKNTYSTSGAVLTFSVAPASGSNNIEVQTLDLIDWTGVSADIAASLALAAGYSTTSAASAAAAEASRQGIDQRIYPGTYASAPTTRPPEGTGSAIQNGDEYFGTDGYTYVRVAGAWVNQTSAAAASAAAAASSATDAQTAEDNAEIAQAAAEAASALTQAISGSVRFATKALMDADLAHAAATFAQVYADSTSGNNSLYYKVGASGSGSWAKYQGDIATEVSLSVTTSGNATATTNTDTVYTKAYGYAVTAAGRATVVVDVSASAAGTLYHMRPNAVAGWDVVALYSVTMSGAGNNDVTPSAGLYVRAGDAVWVSTESGGFIKFYTVGAWTTGQLANPKPTYVGQNIASVAATRIGMLITVATSRIAALQATQNDNTSAVTTLQASGVVLEDGNRTNLFSTNFPGTTTPTGSATAGGVWTFSSGLTPPATGGGGVYWTTNGNSLSSMHRRRMRARIVMNSADTIVGVCCRPASSSNGGVAMIDGVAGKLRMYAWSGSVVGTLGQEVALPAALVVGRAYTLEVEKDGYEITATFRDNVTQQSCTITETKSTTGRLFHGAPGILFTSATTAPKIDWFDCQALYPSSPLAIIVGDSITEGNYLLTTGSSWAYQLAALRGVKGDVIVSGKAGDVTATFSGKKDFDLTPFSPKYVVLALGTNDTSQATWRTDLQSRITEVEARGAEAILCTQIPRTAAQALRTACNTDIRTGFFDTVSKRYRYIDFALSVSSSHDGVTWDSTYDFGDGIHPNAAGTTKMLAQARVDAPFLF